jgi:predicted ATP-grasp superfamily ATP-dependent carboligase
VTSPQHDPAGFARAVGELLGRCQIDLLLPVSDAALAALLSRREMLPPVALPFPDHQTYLRASDKAEALAAGSALGIAVPTEAAVATPEDGERVPVEDLVFPLVLKAAPALAQANGRWIKPEVAHVSSAAQLRGTLATWPPGAYPVLLQRRIAGPGIGVSLLRWEGRTLAAFAHRRLREKPPWGGVSVYRESIAPEPRLVAQSEALLHALGWSGVAMVEYKLDRATGTPYLMEVNPRFWGALQLAVDAGVDFPALLAAAALGRPVAPVDVYRVGLRSRWWWGDVDHLLARLRTGSQAPGGAEPGGRWRALRQFLAWPRDDERSEILRWGDAQPFIRETVDWLRGR